MTSYSSTTTSSSLISFVHSDDGGVRTTAQLQLAPVPVVFQLPNSVYGPDREFRLCSLPLSVGTRKLAEIIRFRLVFRLLLELLLGGSNTICNFYYF
jgi:hypothetical protein